MQRFSKADENEENANGGFEKGNKHSIIAVSLAAITSITAASFSSMNFKLDCQKTVQNAAEEIETDIGTFGKNKFWPQSVTGEINQFKLCRNHYN